MDTERSAETRTLTRFGVHDGVWTCTVRLADGALFFRSWPEPAWTRIDPSEITAAQLLRPFPPFQATRLMVQWKRKGDHNLLVWLGSPKEIHSWRNAMTLLGVTIDTTSFPDMSTRKGIYETTAHFSLLALGGTVAVLVVLGMAFGLQEYSPIKNGSFVFVLLVAFPTSLFFHVLVTLVWLRRPGKKEQGPEKGDTAG